jgi:hypothetical protein
VKSAGVLNQCSFPGYRQRQKQRVQTCIVEPFTNITSSSKYQPLLVIGNGIQPLYFSTASFCACVWRINIQAAAGS